MRTSWRRRNAGGSVVLVAALMAIPIAVLPCRVALAAPATASAGVPHRAVRVTQAAVPALTISVSDGRTSANAGDELDYLVSVRDGGSVGAPRLKITQTLSAGLQFVSASPAGTAAGGQVAWNAEIPAGGTRTFHVVARVTRAPAGLLRLAAVACASAEGSSRPIVCAAHLDQLPAAAAPVSRAVRPTGAALAAYAAAALAVLVAGAFAGIAWRRSRLRRQPG